VTRAPEIPAEARRSSFRAGTRSELRARLRRVSRALAADRSGATAVEFGLVGGILFVLIFALVDFSHGYHQYSSATKALQVGARLAAVSDPVASDLRALTGLDDGAAGGAMPYFERRCSGAASSCSQGAFDQAAFDTILYGRGNSACPATPQANPPMCRLFPRLRPRHLEIDYVHTGLGFAGRPGPAGRAGGPVPTITVRLTNLTFDFLVLNRLLGFPAISMAGLSATATGEDLASAAD